MMTMSRAQMCRNEVAVISGHSHVSKGALLSSGSNKPGSPGWKTRVRPNWTLRE